MAAEWRIFEIQQKDTDRGYIFCVLAVAVVAVYKIIDHLICLLTLRKNVIKIFKSVYTGICYRIFG